MTKLQEEKAILEEILSLKERLYIQDQKGVDLAAEINKQLRERRGWFYTEGGGKEKFFTNARNALREVSKEYENHKALQDEINRSIQKSCSILGVEEDKVKKIYDEYKKAIEANEKISDLKKKILDLTKEQGDLLSGRNYEDLVDSEKERFDLMKNQQKLLEGQKDNIEKIFKESHRNINETRKLGPVYEQVYKNAKEVSGAMRQSEKSAAALAANANTAALASHAFAKNAEKGAKFTNLAGTFYKASIGVVSTLLGLVKRVAFAWYESQDSAYKMGRAIGWSGEQLAKLHRQQLNYTASFAGQYGIKREDIDKIQQQFADVKSRFMSKDVMESSIANSKFSSIETVGQWQDAMDKIGVGAKDANDMMSLAIARAQKFGLNAAKATEDIANNLKLANSYSFSSGVDGITRMSLRARSLRVDLQSILNSAGYFNDIDKAITNSANIQMLGGSYAANFSNPMQTLYESMNDPEALQKRIENTLQGKGTFDRKTGEVRLTGLDMQFIKQFGESSGIGAEAAVQMAKSLTKNKAIGQQIRGRMSDADRAFIENQAQFNTANGQFEIYDGTTGRKRRVSELTAADIHNMQGDAGKLTQGDINADIHDISQRMRSLVPDLIQNEAKSSKSTTEGIQGSVDALGASIGLRYSKEFETIGKSITGFLDTHGQTLINNISGGNSIKDIVNAIKDIGITLAKGLGSAAWERIKQSYNDNPIGTIAGGVAAGTAAVGYLGYKGYKAYNGAKELIESAGNTKFARNIKAGRIIRAGKKEALEAGFSKAEAKEWGKILGDEYKGASKVSTKAASTAAKGSSKFLPKMLKRGGKLALVAAAAYGGYKLFSGNGDEGAVPEGQAPVNGAVNCDVCSELQKQTALLEKIAGISPSGNKELGTGYLEDTAIGKIKGTADASAAGIMIGGNYVGKKMISNAMSRGVSRGVAAKAGMNLMKMSKAANPYAWVGLGMDGINLAGQASGMWEAGSKADKWLNVGSSAANGAAWGSMIGSVVPGLGTGVGAAIGGATGGVYGIVDQFGESIANAFRKNGIVSKNNEAQSNSQLNVETKKIGINGGNIYEKAAMATVGIHDLMISKFNMDRGLNANGSELSADQEFKKGNYWKGVKKGTKSIWNSIGNVFSILFASGGVAKRSAIGSIVGGSSYMGDKVPAMLNSGEMVLNPTQQAQMFKALSIGGLSMNNLQSKGIESLPIIGAAMRIANTRGNSNNGNLSLGNQSINLNVTGTIKLDAGGGNMANLDASKLLNDTRFISQIADLVADAANSRVNGGRVIRSSSSRQGMYTPDSNRWGGVNQT